MTGTVATRHSRTTRPTKQAESNNRQEGRELMVITPSCRLACQQQSCDDFLFVSPRRVQSRVQSIDGQGLLIPYRYLRGILESVEMQVEIPLTSQNCCG